MTFPTYVDFQVSGFTRSDSSITERSDMERGPAKTRRVSEDPVTKVSGKLHFRTAAAQLAFDDWFYSRAGANAGAAWFDWTDPRGSIARQARIVSLGELTVLSRNLELAEQAIEMEYIRKVSA